MIIGVVRIIASLLVASFLGANTGAADEEYLQFEKEYLETMDSVYCEPSFIQCVGVSASDCSAALRVAKSKCSLLGLYAATAPDQEYADAVP